MNNCYPFVNTPLPYAYNALEPYIDEKTMRLHHDKHLQTYIDGLNKLLKSQPALQSCSLQTLLANWNHLPVSLRNNAGGVYNHRFFFDSLIPCPKDFQPAISTDNKILPAIEKQFCGFDRFCSLWKESALSVFGSGYVWLVCECGMLKIITTANQNVPDLCLQTPLLNLDVWEHAYYLKHYNMRADYIDDWFHLINWDVVHSRYCAQNNKRTE